MIEIKYNGKKFTKLSDAILQATIKAIEENINKKLSKFKSEIRKENGTVSISIPKDLKNIEVDFENISEELMVKIKKAL